MRDYLRNLRLEHGESLDQVAAALGVTRQYYSLIERGERKRSMDVETLNKIAMHFGVGTMVLVIEETRWKEHRKEE